MTSKLRVKRKLTKVINLLLILLVILPSFTILGVSYMVISQQVSNDVDKISTLESLDSHIEAYREKDQELLISILNLELAGCTISNDFMNDNSLLCGVGMLGFLAILELVIVVGKNTHISRKRDNIDVPDGYEMNLSLLSYERMIFNDIQEYMGGNRCFEMDKILSNISAKYAKAGLNLNRLGIRTILESFMSKNLILEGSKLTGDDILENMNRAMIYGTILQNSGIHFMKIVRNLKMNNFLVRWHLDMLLKFNLIKSERIGNYEIYYDISIDPEEARLNHLISIDKCAKIINYLKENKDGSTKYQLTKNLGMHPNTITKYLDRLDEFGHLFKKNLKNKTLYFIDEKLLV